MINSRLTPDAAKQGLDAAQLRSVQERDLGLVLGPYLGIAAVLVLIWLLIFFSKNMHNPLEDHEREAAGGVPHAQKGVLGRNLPSR